ncbi:uncharacterized protein I303_101261 [Kwoniella dejecticola CBS 10117]|uniref:Uncharacterized protein n=1 Tax=Kwoniella dejecticola CBS 10117 TaxID=1296121 RepID=A0A1A6AHA4_9TREE|nr:uncharacterized protein I303_01268 [Kwoniella dejecticola CBS 10117]OBR89441.1 hypothetical protein I303_01268 [Kwoniella dejecticola CBS 10117]
MLLSLSSDGYHPHHRQYTQKSIWNRKFNLNLNLVVCSIFALLLIFPTPINALTEFQVLETVKQFADGYIAPKNIEIARSINSTLFAEDVTGTADLSTNFDGRELSTEYLFGLFVNTAEDPTDPSPFGSPISYNVTALLVQHEFVSTSIKFIFNYPSLNQSFPIQIDAFMKVNDNREIEQYDVSFRRWAWATDVIVPKLIPLMAERPNVTAQANDTDGVLRQYMSNKICKTALDHCQGPNEQYESWEACMDFLNGRDIGHWYRMGEDNLVCRHLHVPMLPLRPEVHCPHVGPTGGDMCISRDYDQVVLDSHFPQGWLAPAYITPENKDEVAGIQATSAEDLDPLIEIALSPSESHSWDPTLYATALLGYFLFFYVVSNLIWFIYFRRSAVFPTAGLEHQKNIVMYTMNIIFTTIALALELVASPAFAGRYHLWEVQALRTAGILTSALYIFELIYRLKMRIPMIAHHFLTIIAISFTVTVFEYTQSMSYLCSAIIWLFQATTEQPTFVGLLGYRLEWNPRTVSKILKIASLQTFILKSASAIALIAYWGVHQNYSYNSVDRAWTAMVFIIAIGLLLTQIWGSWVTYQIARRIERQPPALSNVNPAFKNSNLAIYQTIRSNSKEKDPHLRHQHQDSSLQHQHRRNDSIVSSSSTIEDNGSVDLQPYGTQTQRYRDTDQNDHKHNHDNMRTAQSNRSRNRLTRLPSLSFLHDGDNGQRQTSLLTKSDYNKVDERVKQGTSISSISPLLNTTFRNHNHEDNGNDDSGTFSKHTSTSTSSDRSTINPNPDKGKGSLGLDPTVIPLPKSPAISPISTTLTTRNNDTGGHRQASATSPSIPLTFNFLEKGQEGLPK